MPPALAAHFTCSQLAVLKIVGDEHSEYGCCAAYLDAIAARAGCCRKTARDAIRWAARHGLVTIQERRREGRVNLTNVVRVVSAEWLQWLAIGPRHKPAGRPEGIGYKNFAPTVKTFKYLGNSRAREKQNRPAATPPNSARKEGPPSAGLAAGRSANSEPSRPKPPADPKLEAAIARFLGGRVRP